MDSNPVERRENSWARRADAHATDLQRAPKCWHAAVYRSQEGAFDCATSMGVVAGAVRARRALASLPAEQCPQSLQPVAAGLPLRGRIALRRGFAAIADI